MSQETNTTSAVREAGQNKIKSLVEEFGSTLQEVWDACPFVNDLFSAAFVSIHQIKERAKTDAAAVLKNPAHEPAYRECVEQWLLAVSYFANRYVASATRHDASPHRISQINQIDGKYQYRLVVKRENGELAAQSEFSEWFENDDEAAYGMREIMEAQGQKVIRVEIGFPLSVVIVK